MTNAHIQALEAEISQLTKRRSRLFDEWAKTVKKNEIEYELYGSYSFIQEQKAKELLAEQKYLSKKILKILKRIHNLHIKVQ